MWRGCVWRRGVPGELARWSAAIAASQGHGPSCSWPQAERAAVHRSRCAHACLTLLAPAGGRGSSGGRQARRRQACGGGAQGRAAAGRGARAGRRGRGQWQPVTACPAPRAARMHRGAAEEETAEEPQRRRRGAAEDAQRSRVLRLAAAAYHWSLISRLVSCELGEGSESDSSVPVARRFADERCQEALIGAQRHILCSHCKTPAGLPQDLTCTQKTSSNDSRHVGARHMTVPGTRYCGTADRCRPRCGSGC